jgi:hypothetical protein
MLVEETSGWSVPSDSGHLHDDPGAVLDPFVAAMLVAIRGGVAGVDGVDL